MKTTKLKDFKNMVIIRCFLFSPTTSLPFFYAFSFTVKKMADFCQKLLLQKHVLSHVRCSVLIDLWGSLVNIVPTIASGMGARNKPKEPQAMDEFKVVFRKVNNNTS